MQLAKNGEQRLEVQDSILRVDQMRRLSVAGKFHKALALAIHQVRLAVAEGGGWRGRLGGLVARVGRRGRMAGGWRADGGGLMGGRMEALKEG